MADDEIDEIHAALADDGVYIHPELQRLFTPQQERELESLAGPGEPAVFVVAYPFDSSDPYSGVPFDLLTRLHDAHPEPGVYLSSTSAFDPGGSVNTVVKSWDVTTPDEFTVGNDIPRVATHEHPSSLPGQLLREAELARTDPAEITRLREQVDAEVEAEDPQEDEGDRTIIVREPAPPEEPGDAGVGTTPYLLGALVLLAAGAAGVAYWRKRQREGYTLPASLVDHARAAHDRRLERTAREELLELGEAIDRADIGEDHHTASWQAAIDHYEAGGRVLARNGGEPEVLDVVGALVLARRGAEARRAAEQGGSWTPTTLCYLNPLHGRSRGNANLASGGRRVSVPLCSGCRRDLRAHRRPDILDVVRRGRAVHYFDSGAEPWASIGYGSLETDLIGRLHRQPR